MSQNTAATIVPDATAPAPEQIQGGGWTSIIPMVLIFVVFYFLLIRPQEKKRKAQEQLVSTAKVGEEVVTHSGIYGKISKINESDNTVMLTVANGVDIKILKTAIADILNKSQKIEADAKVSKEKSTETEKNPKKSTKKAK